MVVPPLIVWVAMLTLEPLTVPTHVSTPSLNTTLVIPAALDVTVISTVPLVPGHERVPL
jgi:hypothetical protein